MERKRFILIYEAYESMAVKKLEQIGREIEEKWAGSKVAITHRVGQLGYYGYCRCHCCFYSTSCRFL